jgi:hypothetical protein
MCKSKFDKYIFLFFYMHALNEAFQKIHKGHENE